MDYTITVERKVKDGNLIFTGGEKTITAKCYWNTEKKDSCGYIFRLLRDNYVQEEEFYR